MSDASGSTAWTYDARGRLMSEVKTVTGVGSFKTTWGYNSADLVAWMKYPANASGGQGETVYSTYLPQMAVNSLSGTSVYVQSTQYDAAGRLTLRVLGANTLRTTQSYYAWNEINGQGRLHFLQTETTTKPPTSLQNLEYGYDAVGNVLTITDQNAGGVQTQTFTYDSLNRLRSASATGGSGGIYASETYTYDEASGNLSSKAGTAYGYGLQSDLCNAKSTVYKPHAVMSAGSAIFCYDANGNMTQKIDGSTTSYTYDAENRMTAVSGAASATFVYDGDGNRVKGVVGGVTTTYIGNYFEWTGLASTRKQYYYAGGTRLAERKGTTLYWLLSDHLGSTSITATSSGSKTAEVRYKAWGETRYTYGTTQTTIRYTGQREESSLGLYWYASRWYSPYITQFTQPDTIIPDPTNPLVWDRYSYSHNNPINYVDPTGHKACSPTIDGGCDTFEEEVLKLIEKIVDAIESTSKDDDNDGYPETPDKNAPPVSIGTTPGCSQGTYVECFYSRDLLDIFTKMKIDQKQMASLVVAVYYDLNKRSRGLQDRAAYDTPFWDFYGEAPGDACYGGHCFKRQEINYFAQGMYTNANGESRLTGLGTVYAWKMLKYGEMPSDGTLLWFDLGYLMYSIIQEGQ